MFDIALGVFLLLSPIFFLPAQAGNINALQLYQFGVLGNSGYNFLQLQFFCYGIVVLFIIALLSKPQREFNERWITALLSVFCVSIFIHPIGIKLFAPVFLGFLLCYLVIVYAGSNHKLLFKFILYASLLNTVFAVLQSCGINPIYYPTGRIDGLMLLSTHLGVYQAIALPVCYALNPFLAIIPIIGIILSKSVTAVLIMLAWLMVKSFTGIQIKGKIYHIASLPVFMFLLSLAGLFLWYNWGIILQKVNIRLIVWVPVIKDISRNLLFGVGLKNFQFNSPVGLYENPCSIYLGLIRWLGVLAIIPVVMLIKKVISLRKNIIAESVLIALIAGVEKSIMDFPRLAGTVIVLFSLLMIKEEGA